MIEEDIKSAGINIIENNIEFICKHIMDKGKMISSEVKLKYGRAFNTYIDKAITKYSKCKTLLQRDTPVFLYDIYVNLSVSNSKKSFYVKTLNDLTKISNYILISGTGGGGKTTLMRHLFLNTIMTTEYIPLYIELRNINSMRDEDNLIDLMFSNLRKLGFDLEKKYFEKALKSGKFVILLDALDEVDEKKREKLSNDIKDIVDIYKDNIFIVSSRDLEIDKDFVGWSRFTNFKMNKLSKESSLELVEKINYDSSIKKSFSKKLKETLYDQHESFASNPLLLTIMLMTYDQYAEIPSKLHIFYQQAFETMYAKHDAVKDGYKRRIESGLDMMEFESFLSSFSLISYLQKTKSFDELSLSKNIKKAISMEELNIDYKKIKQDMVEGVCILMQDGLEYVFTHRTFQEFFTAYYIQRCNDTDQEHILSYIFENLSSSIKEDILINMLMNTEEERMEKNFIIPNLKKLYSTINADTEGEQFFNYICNSFENIEIDLSIDDENDIDEINEINHIYFSGFKEGEKYQSLLSFIYDTYIEKYPFEVTDDNDDESVVKAIKLLGECESENEFWTLSLETLDCAQKKYFGKELIKGVKWYRERFLFGKHMLKQLNKKFENKPKIEELINSLLV